MDSEFECFQGYYTPYGFLGWVPTEGKLILFATYEEYEEYMKKED